PGLKVRLRRLFENTRSPRPYLKTLKACVRLRSESASEFFARVDGKAYEWTLKRKPCQARFLPRTTRLPYQTMAAALAAGNNLQLVATGRMKSYLPSLVNTFSTSHVSNLGLTDPQPEPLLWTKKEGFRRSEERRV